MIDENEKEYKLRLLKGPAAAHVYLYIGEIVCCQLTLDWSYDGVYYKYYNDPWITLSIGSKTDIHEIYKIDKNDKKMIFKKLAFYFIKELPEYSGNSDASLIKLQGLADLFV